MCKHFAKHEAESAEPQAVFTEPETKSIEPELAFAEPGALGAEPKTVYVMPETDDSEHRGFPLWAEILFMVAGTLLLALFIRVFIAETFEVPTGSMLETIKLGDRVVCEKVTLMWSSPQAGDIVTFKDPDGSGATLIKRVIATAGQTVDLQGGFVLVDGQQLDESYTLGKPSFPIDGHAPNLTEDLSYPYTVPEGCIWVMGDNRTNSLDSRYFGAIPVKTVTSKAMYIYWPPSHAHSV